ncbi:hypothetical protein [Thermanaeromonas sp. C210]|uniref:hypothetical protein n=1 Tax=Thermanaeromonas sp. C210 TaxID=2731925 RepID=UPI00155B5A7E|nr:hypothetical protein [Thermanaeromonas sp. C210]GFN22745.1 hypothetical protein TAMC210_10620 [Thermanaeromonas sp. C210]
MTDKKGKDAVDAAEYERVICQVKGVLSARLVTGPEGSIEEIHVLASPERNPKQVVRDIETAVLVQLGTPLDHKKISVAQLEEQGSQWPDVLKEPSGPHVVSCGRLRLRSLDFSFRGLHARVKIEVEIEKGGEARLYEGHASGTNWPGRGCFLVAHATLEAVGKHLGQNHALILEDLRQLEAAGSQAILVVVGLMSTACRERLAGVAFLDEAPDEFQATAKAVFRALACRFCLYRS